MGWQLLASFTFLISVFLYKYCSFLCIRSGCFSFQTSIEVPCKVFIQAGKILQPESLDSIWSRGFPMRNLLQYFFQLLLQDLYSCLFVFPIHIFLNFSYPRHILIMLHFVTPNISPKCFHLVCNMHQVLQSIPPHHFHLFAYEVDPHFLRKNLFCQN